MGRSPGRRTAGRRDSAPFPAFDALSRDRWSHFGLPPLSSEGWSSTTRRVRPPRSPLVPESPRSRCAASPGVRNFGSSGPSTRAPKRSRSRRDGDSPGPAQRRKASAVLPSGLFHRNALRQVARLVNVGTSQDRDVICKQLQGHDRHDRAEEPGAVGHPEHMIRQRGN